MIKQKGTAARSLLATCRPALCAIGTSRRSCPRDDEPTGPPDYPARAQHGIEGMETFGIGFDEISEAIRKQRAKSRGYGSNCFDGVGSVINDHIDAATVEQLSEFPNGGIVEVKNHQLRKNVAESSTGSQGFSVLKKVREIDVKTDHGSVREEFGPDRKA